MLHTLAFSLMLTLEGGAVLAPHPPRPSHVAWSCVNTCNQPRARAMEESHVCSFAAIVFGAVLHVQISTFVSRGVISTSQT